MKATWLHSKLACRLLPDLAGPVSAFYKACLYHAALPAKKLMPLCGVKETETAHCGDNLAVKHYKQDRAYSGGAVCVYLPM